jgi:DNA-binding NtrC family response regulator
MKYTAEFGARAGRPLAGASGKTVLIVDDNEGFRFALAELLRMEERGLTVQTVENGEQAAAVIRNAPVDLVITDLLMPVMDGSELLLWMSEYRSAVPVIVVSAGADAGKVFDLKTQGIVFFDKPLDFAGLARTVHSLLS